MFWHDVFKVTQVWYFGTSLSSAYKQITHLQVICGAICITLI